jgi:hypothetical protein
MKVVLPNDDWFESSYSSRHKSTPDTEKAAEKIVTMHEKMYQEATKSGQHTIGGGSEQIHSPEAFGPGGPLIDNASQSQ